MSVATLMAQEALAEHSYNNPERNYLSIFEPDHKWTPDSWRRKKVAQEVVYPDQQKLEDACQTLRMMPPLIPSEQIERARIELSDVALGKAFMLQGGDCAESFDDVQLPIIRKKTALLHAQAELIENVLGKPVVMVGRIAGQYAKPRSQPFETLPDGKVVHAFKGHNVNSPSEDARDPDPQRLISGYFHAAVTLNTLNQLEIETGKGAHQEPTALYTSHEALHLPYESAMTKGGYNTSATVVWLGERTRQLTGAHVEYLRGLSNPVGIKIGPNADPEEVVKLLDVLSPNKKQAGKVTIITRCGAGKAQEKLPSIVRAVKNSGHIPVWVSDPCHGNTIATSQGIKTRKLETILQELKETFLVHQQEGTHLGGIHLEQTGEEVTECLDTDGSTLKEVQQSESLEPNYRSLCDPRLSANQAMKVVSQLVDFIQKSS